MQIHAIEFSGTFMLNFKDKFKKSPYHIYGSSKQNIVRIAQKIMVSKCPFMVTDMIRVTIEVDHLNQISQVIDHIIQI